MSSILSRLLSPKSTSAKAPSSGEIEAELVLERASLAQALPVLDSLIERRRKMLLVDSDQKQLDQVDAEISAAVRTRDKHSARSEALENAFADAVERERKAAVQQAYDKVVAKIAAAKEWQNEQYERVARELAEGFRLLLEADQLAESNIQVPEGCEPLLGPSVARHTGNLSLQSRLYVDTRKLQSLDPEGEPLWQLPFPMPRF